MPSTLLKQPPSSEQKTDQLIELLQRIANEYAPVAFANSLGAEDMVLTDVICKHAPSIEIFSLDTGRLPEETYQLMQKIRDYYGLLLRSYAPQTQAVEEYVLNRGPNAFYESVELRQACCHIRKVEPLRRALVGKQAWLTGMRRQQSVTRAELPLEEWDRENALQKFNPLILWSHGDVWSYLRKYNVPYNPLHDKGYPSIGCAPCSRATAVGEDIRAGRWWWENEDTAGKECGLHRMITLTEIN